MTPDQIITYLAALADWRASGYANAAPRAADTNLCNADLESANLCNANLGSANLRDANLRDANLRGANLCNANLRDTDLRGANLEGANLRGANLRDTDLRGANLGVANLRDTDLRGADLEGANLRGANLRGANLRGANLPAGYRWEVYLATVVPALLTGGGKTLETVIKTLRASGGWAHCHTWTNCPLHVAYDATSLEALPPHLRWEGQQFVHFFDAGLIPEPTAGRLS